MPISIRVASEKICALPKSIYNICNTLTFIKVMRKFMCGVPYLICCIISFICNES